MKMKLMSLFWFGLIVCALVTTLASAGFGIPPSSSRCHSQGESQNESSCGPQLRGPGNGGDIPTPFLRHLPKMELASGEVYTLIGKVKVFRSQVYFEIDFDSQPYLESQARKKMPFYPLKGSVAYWQRYNGQRLKVTVEARGRIQKFSERNSAGVEESLVYVIELTPLTSPSVPPANTSDQCE